MSKISQQEINNIRNNIEAQALDAVDAVRAQMRGRSGTARELSNAAANIIRNTIPYFADNAQFIAQSVFDEINYRVGNNVRVEFYDDLIDWSSINAKIRALALQYADDNLEEFYNQLYYIVADEVRGASRKSMGRNCELNKIPTQVMASPDACLFCITMASRGPVNWDEDGYADGGFFHDHCNCILVPAGVDYEGSNPEDYEEEYIKQTDEKEEARKEGIKRGDGRFKEDASNF